MQQRLYIHSLALQQFRNFKDFFIEFDPSLNVICGANAQGKTSLLEAIHYLMIGRSFRSRRYHELILIGTPSFYLETLFSKHGVDQKLSVFADYKQRKLVHNNTFLPNTSNLFGIIPGVLMTTDDVNLIKGAPLRRRQFFDLQIAQVDPLYVHYLVRYVKAMQHRNQLLKQKKLMSIESWEYEMAHAASYLVMQRRWNIESLANPTREFYSYLTEEKELLSIKYLSEASTCQSESEIKQFYIQQYQKNRAREMALGLTLSGPHKDDLWIGIGERDVRYFASEGEQRSSVTALHMSEWHLLKKNGSETPLLMIDDIGMGLDEKRKKRLLNSLTSLGQVFLTTTDLRLADSFKGSKKNISLG